MNNHTQGIRVIFLASRLPQDILEFSQDDCCWSVEVPVHLAKWQLEARWVFLLSDSSTLSMNCPPGQKVWLQPGAA